MLSELIVSLLYKINNLKILNLFKIIKKEDFVSDDLKSISYNDLDIHLHENRGYLKNLHIAQLINNSGIRNNHKVLHIGGMTGYVSVILSMLSKELIVIENNQDFILQFNKNIKNLTEWTDALNTWTSLASNEKKENSTNLVKSNFFGNSIERNRFIKNTISLLPIGIKGFFLFIIKYFWHFS